MQDINRNFYEDFGTRLRFVRKKRGLPLAKLSDGAASTAKSWEDGVRPKHDQWEPIAERLGLSISFVFLGKPTSKADFDFVAKFADELPPLPFSPQDGPAAIELADSASTGGSRHEVEARMFLEELLALAKNDPALTGWIVTELRHMLTETKRRRSPRSDPDNHPLVEEAVRKARENEFSLRGPQQVGSAVIPKAGGAS